MYIIGFQLIWVVVSQKFILNHLQDVHHCYQLKFLVFLNYFILMYFHYAYHWNVYHLMELNNKYQVITHLGELILFQFMYQLNYLNSSFYGLNINKDGIKCQSCQLGEEKYSSSYTTCTKCQLRYYQFTYGQTTCTKNVQ